jgi:hypothetical protein
MPIRIQWQDGNPVAECDTAIEAADFMRAAQNGKSASHAKPELNGHLQRNPQRDFVAFFQEQKPNVQTLLKGLYQAGREVEAEELGKLCGINKNAFGGMFGALSKTAKKSGISLSSIYKKDVRLNGSRREVWYAPAKLLKEHGGAAFNV